MDVEGIINAYLKRRRINTIGINVLMIAVYVIVIYLINISEPSNGLYFRNPVLFMFGFLLVLFSLLILRSILVAKNVYSLNR